MAMTHWLRALFSRMSESLNLPRRLTKQPRSKWVTLDVEALEGRWVPSLVTLASFNSADGRNSNGRLVVDNSGNLFGTTTLGGTSNLGKVFEVKAGSDSITTLASFNGTNGSMPEGDLVRDSSGNLFGTTYGGGSAGFGTVFEVKAGSDSITTLASFDSINGANPITGLVADSSGNLFGTTNTGTTTGNGTAFEVKAGSDSITTLAFFNGSSGVLPAGLIVDSSDNLFGTTLEGGTNNSGTVFEVKAGSNTVTALASFNGANGGFPEAGLVEDGSGNLFGTASVGGANDFGAVFEVKAGSNTITVLASFDGTNGRMPKGDLVLDSRGNLFGTASEGGANNQGTVFEVRAGSSIITTLTSFNGSNGSGPAGGLVANRSGNLFGTTLGGGASGLGTVFRVNPPPSIVSGLGAYRPSDGSWSLDSDGVFGFNPLTDQVFQHFSPPSVTGVAGDWTGTGHDFVGDFSNGTWHLDLAGTGAPPGPNETFQFGQAGDQPVVGDWNADGKDDLGVFRTAPDGITGEFILDTNEDRVMDAGDETFTFGRAKDRIIVGDWNGDGRSKVGVFRDAASFVPADIGDAVFSLDSNNNHTFDAGDAVFVFGLISDGLVIGDWNGNGVAKVGVYRPAAAFGAPNTAVFSLDQNGDFDFAKDGVVFLYGLANDQFVSGKWVLTPPLQPAEFAASGPGPGVAPALTPAQLEPVLQQAIAAWVAAGADAAQLQAARVRIGQLDDNLVGWTSGNQITLDAGADGWGWNADPSAADFTTLGPDGWRAQPGSAAAGEMDLLTVVEHELGHVLGYDDVDSAAHPASLMASTLPAGTRRTIGD